MLPRHEWGIGRHLTQAWERYHSYYGSMRDRMPNGRTAGIEGADIPLSRRKTDSFGHRLAIRPTHNLCFIRSIVGWDKAKPHEQEAFISEVLPNYLAGVAYLRGQSEHAYCISARAAETVPSAHISGVQAETLAWFTSLARAGGLDPPASDPCRHSRIGIQVRPDLRFRYPAQSRPRGRGGAEGRLPRDLQQLPPRYRFSALFRIRGCWMTVDEYRIHGVRVEHAAPAGTARPAAADLRAWRLRRQLDVGAISAVLRRGGLGLPRAELVRSPRLRSAPDNTAGRTRHRRRDGGDRACQRPVRYDRRF